MAKRWDNSHYKQFVASLDGIIFDHLEGDDSDSVSRQKRTVERLCELERQFRDALIRDKRGPEVYKEFVRFVRDQRRNILSARPYFRERQDVFKAKIAPALRERQDKALYQFNINYQFIAFALRVGKFPPSSRIAKIAAKADVVRQKLIEVNIPLAISRARVFDRYKQQHLEYMDLVQIATGGLIVAIDKFVLPYTKSFGAVLYGRITGDLVEGNSETLVHFFPMYKRLLYTTNKLVKEGKTFEQIADIINAEARAEGRGNVTNYHDLQQLHVAAYTVSGDSPGSPSEESSTGLDESPINRFEADESWRPDVKYEKAQLHRAVKSEINNLTLFERKLLAMKGIDL